MGLRQFATPLSLLAALSDVAFAQNTATAPGQPRQTGAIGQFEIIGNSGVSAQQLFLGTEDKIYIIDKVEGNPLQIGGHPAWAVEYSLESNTAKPLDIVTNSFCAGGNVMADGTWLNVGGNQAVTYGGEAAESQTGGGAYDDPDGRQSTIVPCDDDSCTWKVDGDMTTQRWYPTVEGLEDGSLIILGGCTNGGYVNDAGQDNPTYEFFPSKGDPQTSHILQTTLPTNLFPLTWLLPSGKILLQSNWDTALLNYHTGEETPLDTMPDAVRTYPASAGTIMLPLTPANNYTATVFWNPQQTVIVNLQAVTSCQKITPDVSGSYVADDPLPQARVMGQLIYMPTGMILMVGGAGTGTAGYGNDTWAIGHSYADDPILTPVMYNPDAPAGKRWSSDGLGASTVPRMYHSTATLVPDGSVIISGSNPNPDYTVGDGVKYPTDYRVERFYPSYYNQRRPQPKGLLTQLTYGGSYFDVTLDSDDLFGDVSNIEKTKVVVIRTGFATHTMNMGQRYVELKTTYSGYNANNTAILHIVVGNGKVGTQEIKDVENLPDSNLFSTDASGNGGNGGSDGSKSNSSLSNQPLLIFVLAAAILPFLVSRW
ncbi:copper radical oxidase [Hymenopellis radicata]|nr:copper radical oxidase [Hymenopellis radicata]